MSRPLGFNSVFSPLNEMKPRRSRRPVATSLAFFTSLAFLADQNLVFWGGEL